MESLAVSAMCVVCGTVLEGPVSLLLRAFGVGRSSRNPNLCNRCDTHLEEGRIVELTVFFADLVSFTEMTNELGAERAYEVVNAFFQLANKVLIKNDAFIDKYIGDAVMAIFNAPIQHPDHAHRAVSAALDLQEGIKDLQREFDLDLQTRIGVATGYARVGRIGSDDRKDYTAIGDVVNLSSRLEGQALPGEIILNEKAYTQITDSFAAIAPETLSVKGFKEPVRAYRINPQGTEQRPALTREPETMPDRRMSVGAVLFAILGAPCAAASVLGPLSVVLGAGALMGAATPFLMFMDRAPIRLTIQALAILGAAINLYVIWYSHRLRQSNQASGGEIALTTLERRRMMLVGGMAVASLLVIAFELYAHMVLMGEPLI